MGDNATIIYEQPLNEHIRVCLRLEHLFGVIKHYLADASCSASRAALNALLEVVNVADRPDLRGKLSKALSEHQSMLLQLEKIPDIDSSALQKILHQVGRMMERLHGSQGKFGQELRDNEFLFALQQRLSTPGGTAPFSMPAYYLWLKQPIEIRTRDLERWLNSFHELQDITNLLLQLTRDSTELKPKNAERGFFQANLDPNLSYQMIRIVLPIEERLYPEISVGRHRLSIYLFQLNTQGHATQVQHNVAFELACCKI